jgi:hypothetical protein
MDGGRPVRPISTNLKAAGAGTVHVGKQSVKQPRYSDHERRDNQAILKPEWLYAGSAAA